MPATTLSHYTIREKLGEGGMGEVYRAEDTRLGRSVALKILPDDMAADPSLLQRFQREARAVAALNHPNIVTVHSVEEADGTHFIVMELVEGKTLAEVLLTGALPLDTFFDLTIGIADAMSVAHDRGITHRDLKPANIMVNADGRVKVLDFGLAKLRDVKAPSDEDTAIPTATLTQDGRILGTVPYMSPEQVQGRAADHRTDIFSFGIILYEMATGRRPFQGETSADLISSILRDTPRPATEVKVDLPRDLGRIIRRCLEKDLERRYQTAKEIRNELEDLKSDAASGGLGAQQSSIAVLPFVDMSPDGDQQYFCDGIAEELINALSKAGGSRVASRTSAFRFKGQDQDIREIGDKLNVSSVLEGSVRKAGNRLRINAQLVNVTDGYQLWAETFDRDMEDVFAIQDEISQNITHALELVFTDSDGTKKSDERKAALVKKAPTENVQAYEFYLRGRQLFHEFSRRALERASRLFKRAYELDPAYANPYAGVADCSSLLYMYWDASEARLREAEETSRKALQLDPDSAEAHASRGLAVSLSQHYHEAAKEFEAAIDLNPELFEAFYFYARASVAEGKLEQAAELFEQACQRRPEDYAAPNLLGPVYRGLGRKTESDAAYRRALEACRKHLELFPEDQRALYMGAQAMVALGDRDQGLDWATRALAPDPEDPVTLYNVGCVYALLGESDRALKCLDEAVTFGMGQKEWIEHDSDLDSLRDDPLFQELLDRL